MGEKDPRLQVSATGKKKPVPADGLGDEEGNESI